MVRQEKVKSVETSSRTLLQLLCSVFVCLSEREIEYTRNDYVMENQLLFRRLFYRHGMSVDVQFWLCNTENICSRYLFFSMRTLHTVIELQAMVHTMIGSRVHTHANSKQTRSRRLKIQYQSTLTVHFCGSQQ